MLGALPALLVLYIRSNVPESPDWETRATPTHRASVWDLIDVLSSHVRLVVFAVLMMTAFNVFSHGTQDLYKSFLMVDHRLPLGVTTTIIIFMNVAAITGGIVCASLSQRVGRRAAIVVAALLSLPVLPFWAFANDPLVIGIAAFAIQLCVQGAWGVIPAHLNELSPPAIRGTFPGLTYTIGNLLASVTPPIQSRLADAYFHKNLSWPLALVVATAALTIAVLVSSGREARDVRMGRERTSAGAGVQGHA
jgi:SHS family lactate transporter-like MFS transporter